MIKMLTSLAVASVMVMAGGDIAPKMAEVEVAPVSKDFYVGLNGQAILDNRVDFLGLDAFDDAAYGVGVQAGWVFFRSGAFSTAVEGRYTYSWADRTLGDTGVLSAFLKPTYDFGTVAVYGLVGYSSVDIQELGETNDYAYGGGLAVDINEDFEVFADYTINADFESGKIVNDFDNEVVTVGINYKF